MPPAPTAPFAVYSTRDANWLILLLTAALAFPLTGLALSSDAPTGAIVLSVAFVVVLVGSGLLTGSSLRVTSGPQGVTVHFGTFGWPRFRYAAGRIARIELTEITAWEAAWGICWTLRDGLRPSLRSGPALRLTLTSGRRVTINVDDPERAIAALGRNVTGTGIDGSAGRHP